MMRGLLAALFVGYAAAGCDQFADCHDCLNHDNKTMDCGWCSPVPAVFADGRTGHQCMDHTSKGWTCFHLYQHDGCIAGYICNQAKGTCELGPPGQGDTKENCEQSCRPTPPPEKQYACNSATMTCEESPEGRANKQGCESTCSKTTPERMVGLWRGLNVQKGFAIGEYVMNFTATTVTWGPVSAPTTFSADVATVGDTLIRLTMSNGDVTFASHSDPSWPTGPETHAIAIALQKDGAHQVPPRDLKFAMGDSNFDVYVMHHCLTYYGKTCDFSSALVRPTLATTSARAGVELSSRAKDACTAHTDCDSCINDPEKVCGFCDGVITFGDGTKCGEDGNGCCGGAGGFSQCNLAYRKVCPVMCDRTNWLSPECREASPNELKAPTTLKFNDCDAMAYFCVQGSYCDRTNASDPQCKKVTSEEECEKSPGCDKNNPTCGDCKPAPPPPKEYYYCDQSSFQCKQRAGTPVAPYFNTSKDCEDKCVAPPQSLAGVWRGLRIEKGFVADEWDFTFSEVNPFPSIVKFSSKKEGKTYKGTYTVSKTPSTQQDHPSFELTVSLSTGEVLTGLYSEEAGPLTRFMYIGLPLSDGAKVNDYDEAMTTGNQEFVLIACLPGIDNCDFSSAAPSIEEPTLFSI